MVETNASVFICAPLLSRQPAIISQKSSQCCHCTDVYLTLSGGIERCRLGRGGNGHSLALMGLLVQSGDILQHV